MKNLVKLLLLIFGTVWLVGTLYQSGRQKFDQRQLKVTQQCEVALPIFQQRYQTLAPLLTIYEKHAGLVNGVFTGNPNNVDVSWEEAQSGVVPMTKLCPDLQYSEGVRSGLEQFNHGGSALDKYQGALLVNDNLQTFIDAAIKCDEIQTNQLLIQLKSDLTATGTSATDACQSVNAAIDQGLTGFVAGRFNIQPMQPSRSQITQPTWMVETKAAPAQSTEPIQ